MGNVKGKPGPRRSAAPPAATAETPYFLPGRVDEATSVEVRRPGASKDDEKTEPSKPSAPSEPKKPIFVPKGGPTREEPKEGPKSVPKSEAAPRSAPSPPSVPVYEPPSRHARFRWLIAIPLGSAIVLSIAFLLVGPDRAGLYRADVAICQALGFWGCLAAALIFDSGDYLRRAWVLQMICYGLIFAGDLTLTTGVFSNRSWAPLANGILTLTANASAMGGTFFLARTARVAGIQMPGSDVTRHVLSAIALAIALAAGGPAAIVSARQVLHGDQGGIMFFASCIGDIFCFAMIAPLLLTTIAMRGGLLAWPWGFMTASGLAWLTYDGVQTLAPILLGISAEKARPVLEVARCLACTCAFSAGLAQRWTILDVSE